VVYQQNGGEDRGVAIDSTGQGVLSRRVPNDETSLKALIDDMTAIADRGSVQWACSVSVFNAFEFHSVSVDRTKTQLLLTREGDGSG
jgi:hypothetical protein